MARKKIEQKAERPLEELALESRGRAMSISHDVHALRPRLYEDVVADAIGNGAWHVHRITDISRYVLELTWEGKDGNAAVLRIPLRKKFQAHRVFWRDAKTGVLHYALEKWKKEDYHA